MNREILFRGKRVDNSEWVDGYYVEAEKLNKSGVEYFIIEKVADGRSHKVIPETVGQYTGFDDKNGKKIFEGDITNKFRTPEVKYAVVYDKEIAAYIGTYKKGYVKHFTTFSNDGDEFEVIGNIHDNADLLEEVQK